MQHIVLKAAFASLSCSLAFAQTEYSSTPFLHATPPGVAVGTFEQAEVCDFYPGGHLDALVVKGGLAYALLEPGHRTHMTELGLASAACVLPQASGNPEGALLASPAGLTLVSWSSSNQCLVSSLLDNSGVWSSVTRMVEANGVLYAAAGSQVFRFQLGTGTTTPLPTWSAVGSIHQLEPLVLAGTSALAIVTSLYLLIVDPSGNIVYYEALADPNATIVRLEEPGTDALAILQKPGNGSISVRLVRPGLIQVPILVPTGSYSRAMALEVDSIPGQDLVMFGATVEGEGLVLNYSANGQLILQGDTLATTRPWVPNQYAVEDVLAADFDADGDDDFLLFEMGVDSAIRTCWGAAVDETQVQAKLEFTNLSGGITSIDHFQAKVTLPSAPNILQGERAEVWVHGWIYDNTGLIPVARLVAPKLTFQPDDPAEPGESFEAIYAFDATGLNGPFWLSLQVELVTFPTDSGQPLAHPIYTTQYSPYPTLSIPIEGGDPWIDPTHIGGQSQTGQSPAGQGPPPLPL